MSVAAKSLLVLLLFPLLFASTALVDTHVCTSVHFGVLDFEGDKGLYINGVPVDRELYCATLYFHLANNCSVHNFAGFRHCQASSSSKNSLENLRKLSQEEKREEESKSSAFVVMSVGGAFCLCCAVICPCCYQKLRDSSATREVQLDTSSTSVEGSSVNDRPPLSPMRVPPSPSRVSNSPRVYRTRPISLTVEQAAKATRNFSPSLLIGKGEVGTVYRALLEDGQVVAIKRADKDYFDHQRKEFSSEVDLLRKLDHKNLVKLLGYVEMGNERLIITEFVPNGTLREHLDGLRGKILDFNQRLEIAIDVAHGLTHLHLYAEKPVIHRDVKSSNVLLTMAMRAKVADFGFARISAMDSEENPNVLGTVGYLDPEYMKTLKLHAKSDVYSFGILLLEIVTGRRPFDLKRPQEERVMLRWAFKIWREGKVRDLVDPMMHEKVPANVLGRIFNLAFSCAAPDRSSRPTMKSVTDNLWAIRKYYNNNDRQK